VLTPITMLSYLRRSFQSSRSWGRKVVIMSRRTQQLPIVAFVVAMILSVSGVAVANFTRVSLGTGGIFNSTAVGCFTYSPNGLFPFIYFCSAPADTTQASNHYISAVAYFANSNTTQPVFACVQDPFSTGGSCSQTPNNNCPNGGVCATTLNISAWTNNPTFFKFIKFTSITSGVILNGYQVDYNP